MTVGYFLATLFLQYLRSLTKYRTHVLCSRNRVLNTGLPGNSLSLVFYYKDPSVPSLRAAKLVYLS